MKRRAIIAYWLMLLVPALILGVAASHLIGREQERINQQARLSALGGAGVIADNLELSVVAAQETILENLRALDPEQAPAILTEWERSNPLIRNVFIWHPVERLTLPTLHLQSPDEHFRFVRRYEGLFAARVPFGTLPENAPPLPEPGVEDAAGPQVAQRGDSWSFNTVNAQKRLAMRQTVENLPDANASNPPDSFFRSGWKPWFSEDRLCLIGWVQKMPGGPIYGVEIEMMALLSHLVVQMPEEAPEGLVYRLLDGTDRMLFQSGAGPLPDNPVPEFTVSLAPTLPHWHVAVYYVGGGPAATASTTFMIVWSLLVAVFLLAIVMGGTLLTVQAHRNMIDAKRKTSFVSNVSHELKTPLTSIRMYAELLSQGRVKDQAKTAHYLSVIVSESQRLTRLVNNVLDFSRLEQGRKKYRIESLDVAQCLRDVLGAHRMRVQETGMDLFESIPPGEHVARVDRDALEQAVLNLIDNAMKYASDGGEILVGLTTESGRCCVRVMDRGKGIPAAHRERIFDKFHRIDDSLTATKPGSGLGLSIARRLMRDQGGDLVYEAREGGGSCFVITLLTRESE